MSIFGTKLTTTTKDVEVAQAADDSISQIAWSPTADLLAVASWSGEVRIFQVDAGGANKGMASYRHEGPVLCVAWSADGTKVISGGVDKAGRMYDLQSGQTTQFAQHDEPIRCIKWVQLPQGGMVVTGSWDKTLRYWDLKNPAPVSTVNLPDRVYAMDVRYPLLVVGTAERHVVIINLTNPGTIYKSLFSPLKFQTRSIACFPDAQGYTIGSIEGRVSANVIDGADGDKRTFSFRCHRKEIRQPKATEVYAVNAISVHPVGTYLTGGADGELCVWDFQEKKKLKSWTDLGGPIVSTDFSRTGQYMAYAISYDWSRGHSHHNSSAVNKVLIHTCLEEEFKPKGK